jgi:hypothetical protein
MLRNTTVPDKARDKAKELWYAIGTLNFVGALAVIVGARTDHIVYLVGVVFLLPGSILSSLAVNSWDHRDFSIHWNCCGTNSVGMVDLFYLPFALFLNMLLAAVIVWAIGKWSHRDKNAETVVGLRQH